MIIQLPSTLTPAQLERDFGYYQALSRFLELKGRPIDAEATAKVARTKLKQLARLARRG